MDKEKDLLEELRLRAAALVEAKEKADDTEDEDDMDDDKEDEIEDGAEDDGKSEDDSGEEKVNEAGEHKFVNIATSQRTIANAEKKLADNPNMMSGPKAGYKTLITVHKKHLAKALAQKNESEEVDM